MHKLYFTLFLLFVLSANGWAQTIPDKDSLLVDSIAKADLADLYGMFNKSTSYFQVGFGIGNQLYNANTQSLDLQETNRPVVYTPTVAYFHKNGFAISANSYLLTENNNFGANQYSVSPSYETPADSKWDFLFSYTHFFINDEYSKYSSPIQNDLYASLVYKKHWLQPGTALGYSTGDSKEVLHLDTTINGTYHAFYDSLTNKLQSFSLIASVEHSFGWPAIFNKDDSLSFTPIVMLNLGTATTKAIDHTNIGASLTPLQKAIIKAALTKRKQKLNRVQTIPFEVESMSLDLQADYTIGNFSIQPDIYLDYYLHQTSQQSFTQTFVVNFNYTF
jgi:hypothetical protein